MFGQDLLWGSPVVRPGDAAAQLAAVRAQVDASVANSCDMVVFLHSDATVQSASPACRRLLGVEPAELIGHNVLNLVHPEDRGRVCAAFASIPNLGDHVRVEFRFVNAHGDIRWVEEVATNLVADPSVGYVVANLRDVTDRVTAEKEVRLQTALLAAAGQAIVGTDTEGAVFYWNAAAEATYGWTADEAIGQQAAVMFEPPGGWDVIDDEGVALLNAGQLWTGEKRVQTKSGNPIPVLVTYSVVFVDGVRVGTVAVASDISERLRTEQATALLVNQIEVDRRRLAAAQASAKLGSFEVNLDTGEITRSDELSRILGHGPGMVMASEFEHIHPDDRFQLAQLLSEAAAGRDEGEITYRIVRPDGEVRWVQSQATAVRGPNSNVIAGTMLDITDRHQAEAALVYGATHDSVTDLPNRATMNERLQSAIASSDADHLVALAVIDIDRFKLVTDGLRHSSGDEALRALATRFRSGLRPNDFVVSTSGDGFAVVRIDVRTMDDAHQLGNDVLVLLDEPLRLADRELFLTVSVGVTLSTASDSPESLLRDADDAMYQAKRDGRNQVKVFDHHARSRAHRRQSVTTALPQALERDELHLEFQPIIDLATCEVAGFESLLRWDHPELGSIPPAEFIPIAEATGLILRIGIWVLDHSLQQLAAWRADPRVPRDLWMSVNVSAQQLIDPRLVEHVRAAAEHAGVPATAVHLEITESVLMDRVDNALGTIVELQSFGFSVSIDDFGTGYSSLSYLSRLPIDTVKIDRSFVGGLGAGATGHDPSIVRAMIALADVLDLDVVAEGVELASQLDFLTELGCTFGQGFLWTASLVAPDALEWMIRRVRPPRIIDRDEPAQHGETTDESPTDLGAAIIEIAHISGRRRRGAVDMTNVLRFDSLEIGLSAGRAWIAGRDIELTTKEFELLAFLAQHAGETFSRSDLLHEVWHSSPTWQNPTTVTEHIHRLRGRIELDPSRPRLICTVRGLGYCFGPPNTARVAS
ncbi:MAG: EAL domain-containing protein [Ilumatobacteraceae bacterium]|nr:EAL domain-containing protein [Ilumatobacteraceae bacterium]